MGQRLTSLGSRITLGVSAPIGGAMAAVAKFGMDFDKAMTESLAIMDNVSADMRKQMEETAFTVARTTKFSATEAAKAYYDLASAGLNANESMQSMETVAQFAQAGVLDLADAGDYLAGAVTAVGDEALGTTGKVQGMAKMADILTAANNSALGTVEDFAKAMSTRAGGAMKQYGLSVEQGVGALMAFAAQNIKGQKAGEQLYIALRDIQKASTKNAATWKQHGIEVYTAEGKLRSMGDVINQIAKYTEGMTAKQKFAAITNLGFLDKSRGAIQALLGTGNDIEKYTKILENSGGTAKRVADQQMNAYANQVARLSHELEILGIKLFQTFVPILEGQVMPALKRGAEILGEFVAWYEKLPDPIKSATIALGLFFAILGPTVYAVGGFISSLSVLAGAFAAPTRAIANFGQAVLLAREYMTASQAASVVYGQRAGQIVQFIQNQATTLRNGVTAWNNWSKGIETASAATQLAGSGVERSILGITRAGHTWVPAAKAVTASTVAMSSGVERSILGISRIGYTWVQASEATAEAAVVATASGGKMAAAWGMVTTAFRTMLSWIPRLLGPWGALAAAIVLAAVALYKWKTNNDAAEAELKKNADQLMKNETKLMDVIRVYEELSHKVKLTKEEKELLTRATEELAKWTGYSADGFRNETINSNALIDSLKLQAQERWNVANAAKEQLALDVMDLRVQREKDRQAALELRRRGTAVMAGTEQIAGIGGRRATAEDRRAEFNRMIEQAQAYEQKVTDIDARFKELGWGVKGGDIKLGKPEPPKPPAKGPVPDPTVPGKPPKERHEREPRRRQSLLDKFLLDMYEMSEAINLAVEQGTPMELMLDEWGDDLLKLQKTGRAWGISFIGNMEMVRQKAEEMDLAKAFSMFDPNAPGMVLDTQDIAYMQKINQAAIDEKEKLLQITKKNNLEASASDKSRSELAIMALDNERDAAIQNLSFKHWVNQKEYDDAVAAINRKHDFEVDKVNETQSTLRARMAEQGVFTRDQLQETADKAEKTYKQMLKDGGYSADQIYAAWKRMTDAQRKLAPRFMDTWKGAFSSITRTVQQLIQTAGMSEDSFMGFIGNLMGSADAAWEAADMIQGAFGQISSGMKSLKGGLAGAGQELAEGFLGLASGIVSGFGSMMQATKPGTSLGKAMIGGAMTGAMTGAAVGIGAAMMAGAAKGAVMGAGIWGAVAGAIVGIMVAYWRGREVRGIMKRVGSQWGTDISSGLAETIKQDKKKFWGNEQASVIYNMAAVVQEAGGWDANLDKVDKLRDVFVMLSTGVFDTAHAAKVLNENFNDIVAAISKTGKIAPPVIAEMIRLNKEMGVMAVDVLAVLEAQTKVYGEALDKLFGGSTKKWTQMGMDIDAARQKVADANAALKDDDGRENQEALATATAELNTLLATQAGEAATAGDQLARMGRLALAGFVAAESSGMGTVAALDAIGPALDSLILSYKALGLSMEGSAVQGLAEFRERVNNNRDLVDSAQALNDLMVAGSITGALNAESLIDMREQGLATYEQLMNAGFSQNETLRMMSGYLNNIYQAHKNLGVPIDEATAGLIQQGIELGIISGKQMDLNSIMMEGMAAMITALGGEVPAAWNAYLSKTKDTNDQIVTDTKITASEITSQFEDMPPVTIPYEFKQVGGDIEYPEQTPRSVEVETPDVPHLAKGGIVYGPTLALVGEREAEVVRPLRDDTHRSSATNPLEGVGMYMDGQRVGNLMFQKHGPRILKNHRVGRR